MYSHERARGLQLICSDYEKQAVRSLLVCNCVPFAGEGLRLMHGGCENQTFHSSIEVVASARVPLLVTRQGKVSHTFSTSAHYRH